GLFIQKEASRTTAEVGDFIDYTVRVKNVSSNAIPTVRVLDHLPAAFAYQKGTTRFEGTRAPDPVGGAGPQLEFAVGAIGANVTVTLTYRVRIGPGALQGDGVNHVQAASDGPPSRISNVATAKVQLQGGVFSDRAIILGKVFVDANTNRVQDPGE